MMHPTVRRHRRRHQHGQAIPIIALLFLLLAAMAGLAIDSGHNYYDRRTAQNASDTAVLAAAEQLASNGTTLTTAPTSTSATLQAAHDFAQNNGYTTTFNHTCDTPSGGGGASFTTSWFDSNGAYSCSATSGYTTKVTFNDPPCGISAGGTVQFPFGQAPCTNLDSSQGLPSDCTSHPYNCLQVLISTRTQNYLMGLAGFQYTYTTTAATAYAQPPVSTGSLPLASAVYLYQPQDGCVPASQQCFIESPVGTSDKGVPSRNLLSCSVTINVNSDCPTLWTNQAKTQFYGYDGNKLTPTQDTPAVQSNGDVYLGQDAIFCDPYNGGTCSNNNAVGSDGLAINPANTHANESKLYCKGTNNGGSTTGYLPCTTQQGAVGNLQNVNGNLIGKEGAFVSQTYQVTYTACAEATSLNEPGCSAQNSQNDCGSLILNGEQVSQGQGLNAACAPPTGDEYTIQPGKYKWIVINHGQYSFDAGSYYITSTAPVDTLTDDHSYANGIDHANENNSDFDLCNVGKSTGCGGGAYQGHDSGDPNACGAAQPTDCLTAGVWIGRGHQQHHDGSNGSNSSCTNGGGGSGGSQAGGGDDTIVSGTGVTFVMGPNSGGFVSTSQVHSFGISGPGPGANPDLGVVGATGHPPVVIDLQNGGFIHLDSNGSNTDGVTGIVYQDPTVTSGGVEVDPGMAKGNKLGADAAINGQVLAYSYTAFGHDGIGVDFTQGYGTSSLPVISNSGNQENSVVTSAALTKDPNGNNGIFTLQYGDEWALDAYDTYIAVGGNAAQFFSQGEWGTATPSSSPQNPNSGAGPSDSTSPLQVARPVGYNTAHMTTSVATYNTGSPAGQYSQYTVGYDSVTQHDTDYKFALPFPGGGGNATWEVSGDWTWGHEKDLGGNSIGNPDVATVAYTFPLANFGGTVSITMGLYDGDHCGDYAIYTGTFSNPGQPGGGQQVNGTVQLEQ